MNNTPEHIDDLIGKWLSGEISPEEKLLLDKWATESAENAAYMGQFRKIHEQAASKVSADFDAEAAWLKVSARINQSGGGGKVIEMVPRKGLSPMWRMAAAVALLIAGTFLIFQLSESDMQVGTIAATNTIVRDTLPDGSMAVVNKGSSLAFEYDSKKKTRKVKLTGEAFFEVKHNEEEDFVVETQGVFVQDIGTAFNVKTSEDGDMVEVQVREGEVRFFGEDNQGILLKAGETGQYNKKENIFTKLQAEDENMSAWADKDFRFRNSPLKRVIKKLNEVYDIPIELSSESLGECRISVNFRQDDIQTIADVIAETLGLQVQMSREKIVLSGEGCN